MSGSSCERLCPINSKGGVGLCGGNGFRCWLTWIHNVLVCKRRTADTDDGEDGKSKGKVRSSGFGIRNKMHRCFAIFSAYPRC